jgi:hypothetical protein
MTRQWGFSRRIELQAPRQSRLCTIPDSDAGLAWHMHEWKIPHWARCCPGSRSSGLRLGCDQLGEQAIDRGPAKGRKDSICMARLVMCLIQSLYAIDRDSIPVWYSPLSSADGGAVLTCECIWMMDRSKNLWTRSLAPRTGWEVYAKGKSAKKRY